MNSDAQSDLSIFSNALEIATPREREAYLDSACGSGTDLRAKIAALLAAAEQGADSLDRFGGGGGMGSSRLEKVGEIVGRYKLLEQIGEGGCGVVYAAEQKEPVRRRVALKVIKAGMDTKTVIARFDAERQALALMDHPNIARFLDAGSTETGRSFFVAELVEGVKITDFCRQQSLSIRERLNLFIQVCHAVQHAHQKGIIHRDLKPSNVLVTLQDGKPAPKIIDFGIAKAIQGRLSDHTVFTSVEQFIGTPAYMSPEQALITSHDIDTRSDVYSLGVLLYELLAGDPPFNSQELLTAGLDQMRRIIREHEAPRPSLRRSDRSSTGSNSHPLPSDLDWIVMKCLEKDRSRRYQTVNGLAADLERHLKHEPVVARPPSTFYRLQKVVRRNKLQVASVAVIGLVLVVASVVSGWQAILARRAEQKANQQARLAKLQSENAQAVKQFLIDNLLGVNPLVGGTDTDAPAHQATQDLVEKIGRSIDGRFQKQPLVEAEIRQALYYAFSALRDFRQAEVHATRMLEIYRSQPGIPMTNILGAISFVATAKGVLGRTGEGLKMLEDVMDVARKTSFAEAIQLTYGRLLALEGRYPEAISYLREGIARRQQVLGPAHLWVKQDIGTLAKVLEDADQWEDAEALWRENLENCRRDHGPEHYLTVNQEFALARLLIQRNRADEGLEPMRRVISYSQKTTGTNGFWTLDAQFWLGRALEQKGEIGDVTALYVELHPRIARHLPYFSAVFLCNEIAQFFVRHHRYSEAKPVLSSLLGFPDKPLTKESFEALVRATAAAHGWQAAAQFCRRNLDRFPDSPWVWLNKAWVFQFVGDDETYRQIVKKVLALGPAIIGTNDAHIPIEIAALGEAQLTPEETTQLESMIESLQAALPHRSKDLQAWGYRATAHLRLRQGRLQGCLESLDTTARAQTLDSYALFLKAQCVHRLGNTGEARALFDQAAALSKSQLPRSVDGYEDFLAPWQIYQFLAVRRETEAVLLGMEGARPK